MSEQHQYPTREQIAEAIEAEHDALGDDYEAIADAVLALFAQPTTSAEHHDLCATRIPGMPMPGLEGVPQPCNCHLFASAPPSIADMVPGTTFTAETKVPPSSTPDRPDRWTVLDNGSAECERHGAVFTADEFDPSSIRDVTPPESPNAI